MESRLDWFRNALGVLLGLVVGFIAMSPVTLKAVAMLPLLSILTPTQNQEVAGYVTFWATADSEGVASLQFRVDGQDLGSPITAGSCRASWDSTQAVDGLHTVQAIGRDEFNNSITSQAVTVRVNNFIPPPTPTPTPTPPPVAPPPVAPPPVAPPAVPPAPPATPVTNSATILFPAANAVVQGTVPVSVAIPAQTQSLLIELKDAWGETRGTWSVAVSPSASAATVQVNAAIGGTVAAANYSLVATAVVNGLPVVSVPVPVRVENTTAAPPPTPTPPTPQPPSNPAPGSSVTILSPAGNALLQGIVPVFVSIPARTEAVLVELKDVWGGTRGTWALPLSPSASAATVQVIVSTSGVPNANYALVATATVDGLAVTSNPVPVRIENSTAVPPAPTPTQPGTGRAPSRFKSPAAEAIDPSLTTGSARPRPEAQPAGVRAGFRPSSSTASQAKAGSKIVLGSTSKPQKSTAPASGKGTSLPAGTIVTVGLGPCTGADPYAKHPTLKGECVSGTWFPRVRKVAAKREQ